MTTVRKLAPFRFRRCTPKSLARLGRVTQWQCAILAAHLLQVGDFDALRWDRVFAEDGGLALVSAYLVKAGLVRKAPLHHYLGKSAAGVTARSGRLKC